MVPLRQPDAYIIRRVPGDGVEESLDFHRRNVGEHLVPRSPERFKELVEAKCVYQVLWRTNGRQELVGLCYIAPDGIRDEFGGYFVVLGARDHGVATALGYCAIANHYIFDPPQHLIAHVHEFNDKPRRVLNRLGFEWDGRESEELPPELFTPDIKKNPVTGKVVGHLFRYKDKSLLQIAVWLEAFSETIVGKNGKKSKLEIDLPLMEERAAYIRQLREIADGNAIR